MKYMSRPKSAAVKDIDINIDIADILGQKYRYCIDIGNGDIDPPLIIIIIISTDNVYDAVIMAEPLREFTRFS